MKKEKWKKIGKNGVLFLINENQELAFPGWKAAANFYSKIIERNCSDQQFKQMMVEEFGEIPLEQIEVETASGIKKAKKIPIGMVLRIITQVKPELMGRLNAVGGKQFCLDMINYQERQSNNGEVIDYSSKLEELKRNQEMILTQIIDERIAKNNLMKHPGIFRIIYEIPAKFKEIPEPISMGAFILRFNVKDEIKFKRDYCKLHEFLKGKSPRKISNKKGTVIEDEGWYYAIFLLENMGYKTINL